MTATESRIHAFLANLPLFKEMTPEEIDRIAQGTQTQNVPRGQILFQKGDPCNGFYLLVYGKIRKTSQSIYFATLCRAEFTRGAHFDCG